jgi:hypothetical protein
VVPIVAAALALASPRAAAAQAADSTAAPADSLRVYLITIGPGPYVWERFGHNAIWVHDPVAGTDLTYNWGMFSFDQVGFLPRLLQGTMLYWMAPISYDRLVGTYVQSNRSVWVQELRVAPERRVELQAALQENARLENAYYRYDYYRDNCSTRVRDALDRAVDGRLRSTLEGVPTGATYRWHTRRLLQEMPTMYTGIQLVLSRKADREIDRWEEGFLPVKLMEALRDVRVPDGAGSGVPLVLSEREVFRSTGPTEPAAPSSWLVAFLAIGVGLAAALVLLAGKAATGRGWARVALALLAGAWSLFAGVAGMILLGAWLFTDHVFWYPNWNLLQLSPLGLPLAALVLALLWRPTAPAWALKVALVCAILSIAGLVLGMIPPLAQKNAEILALTVPANLGVLLALRRIGSTRAPVV